VAENKDSEAFSRTGMNRSIKNSFLAMESVLFTFEKRKENILMNSS
jgi:hypothetical protein